MHALVLASHFSMAHAGHHTTSTYVTSTWARRDTCSPSMYVLACIRIRNHLASHHVAIHRVGSSASHEHMCHAHIERDHVSNSSIPHKKHLYRDRPSQITDANPKGVRLNMRMIFWKSSIRLHTQQHRFPPQKQPSVLHSNFFCQ